MSTKQSLTSYFPFLIFIFCFLFLWFFPVQSQTPQINITLTWSTNTYVPLDYPGKALPTKGSIIEVIANIDSQEVNPQELNYRWFLNEHLQRGKSGKGKSVFGFPVKWTYENEQSIRVEIRDNEENLLSSAYLNIGIVQPQVIIRPIAKKGTLSLESSKLIQKYQISAEQEISFIAQPYFFNVNGIDDLDYKWSFAEKKAVPENTSQPNILLLEIGELNKSIKRNLNILVENKKNSLQKAETTAEINIIP